VPVRRHPLYFEAEREDDLRKVGYSKERRVDPQVIVGLLVDRAGFPLQVGCWEGNKAETTTIIPIVEAFQAAHGIEELVIVADAGMLSATNLTALDDARLRFIVGAPPTPNPAISAIPSTSVVKRVKRSPERNFSKKGRRMATSLRNACP